jgi:D-psicose/D-tagatose/L-ribulose 3-epimerase
MIDIYPIHYQTLWQDNPAFSEKLAALAKMGYSGVELNFDDPYQIHPKVVLAQLNAHGLKAHFLATGKSAAIAAVSLSDKEKTVRQQAIALCKRYVELAVDLHAPGFIVGLAKGRGGHKHAYDYLRESLFQLKTYCEMHGKTLLVEATNHMETSLVNTIEHGIKLLKDLGTGKTVAALLCDTYHMAIEEKDALSALKNAVPYLGSIHFSDQNRMLPGSGSLNFQTHFGVLKARGYTGSIGFEGNVKDELAELEKAIQVVNGFQKVA